MTHRTKEEAGHPLTPGAAECVHAGQHQDGPDKRGPEGPPAAQGPVCACTCPRLPPGSREGALGAAVFLQEQDFLSNSCKSQVPAQKEVLKEACAHHSAPPTAAPSAPTAPASHSPCSVQPPACHPCPTAWRSTDTLQRERCYRAARESWHRELRKAVEWPQGSPTAGGACGPKQVPCHPQELSLPIMQQSPRGTAQELGMP